MNYKNSKLFALYILLQILIQSAVVQGNSSWNLFYPLNVGDVREYAATVNEKSMQVSMKILKCYVSDSLIWYVMRSDEQDVEYHMAGTDSGVFISKIRYPFPVLKFVKYTVHFSPPLPAMRYPLFKGMVWSHEGFASVYMVKAKIRIHYIVDGCGSMRLPFDTIPYFKISSDIHVLRKEQHEIYFYGKGYGYIKGISENAVSILTDYKRAKPESKD